MNKRERYLALATVLVILTAVVYAVIIGPVISGWVNINNQISAKIGMLEKDYAILTNRVALESEYFKLSKYARSGKGEEKTVADTLSFIEDVSGRDSCHIINIKPAGIKDAGSHKEIVIDVVAEANIGQFSKFLYDMENPRDNLINIKSFTLNAKSGKTGILKGTFLISKVLLD